MFLWNCFSISGASGSSSDPVYELLRGMRSDMQALLYFQMDAAGIPSDQHVLARSTVLQKVLPVIDQRGFQFIDQLQQQIGQQQIGQQQEQYASDTGVHHSIISMLKDVSIPGPSMQPLPNLQGFASGYQQQPVQQQLFQHQPVQQQPVQQQLFQQQPVQQQPVPQSNMLQDALETVRDMATKLQQQLVGTSFRKKSIEQPPAKKSRTETPAKRRAGTALYSSGVEDGEESEGEGGESEGEESDGEESGGEKAEGDKVMNNSITEFYYRQGNLDRIILIP